MNQNVSESNRYQRDFFLLYAGFLQLDAVSSLKFGRNRELIKYFYQFYYYTTISKQSGESACKKNEIEEKLNEACRQLKSKLRGYMSRCRNYRVKIYEYKDQNQRSTYLVNANNPDISNAFRCFVDAVEMYEKWRSGLNDEQILKIYAKNLEDRQSYYADDLQIFNEVNQALLKIDPKKLKRNKILKQTLIEFHNAISHLTAIFFGRAQNEKNKTRAINHFRRGALDSYKAIVKDYYCLMHAGRLENSLCLEEIKELRREEYGHIGGDKDLFGTYKKITNKIIASIKPKEA